MLLHSLHNIHEPLWSYFRQCCQSLESMDSNAQFSEIFQTENFNTMNQAEENLVFWKSTYLTWCLNCDIPVWKNVSIFLNYLTLTDLQRSGLNIIQWPIYLSSINSGITDLSCHSCGQLFKDIIPIVSPSKVLLTECASDAINNMCFLDEVNVSGFPYDLTGLVRCFHRHFTCAVKTNNNWTFFDDLYANVQIFPSTSELYSQYST